MSSKTVLEPTQTRSKRSQLMAAFAHMVACNGRRSATDLHVRKLLRYVCAKDRDGNGVARSLEQLADRLLLNVSTARRVIRRAVKHFGLFIVTAQRHLPGGQAINRYSINWTAVYEKCPSPIEASPTECCDTLIICQSGSDRLAHGSSASPAVKKSSAWPQPAISDHALRSTTQTSTIPTKCPCGSHACRSGSDSAISDHAPDTRDYEPKSFSLRFSASPAVKNSSALLQPATSDQALRSTAQLPTDDNLTNCQCGSHNCRSSSDPATSDHALRSTTQTSTIPTNRPCGSHNCRSGSYSAISDHAPDTRDCEPKSSSLRSSASPAVKESSALPEPVTSDQALRSTAQLLTDYNLTNCPCGSHNCPCGSHQLAPAWTLLPPITRA